MDTADKFFNDFGLVTRARTDSQLYLRGTGPEHHLIIAHHGERRLLALAFELASIEDLQKASQIDGASELQPISGLSGGHMVTLTDPDGNFCGTGERP